MDLAALVFRLAADGSHWVVRGTELAYVNALGLADSSYSLGVSVDAAAVRVYANRSRITVYVNNQRQISLLDSRNASATQHGFSATLSSFDDFAVTAVAKPSTLVIDNTNVKFMPNA